MHRNVVGLWGVNQRIVGSQSRWQCRWRSCIRLQLWTLDWVFFCQLAGCWNVDLCIYHLQTGRRHLSSKLKVCIIYGESTAAAREAQTLERAPPFPDQLFSCVFMQTSSIRTSCSKHLIMTHLMLKIQISQKNLRKKVLLLL